MHVLLTVIINEELTLLIYFKTRIEMKNPIRTTFSTENVVYVQNKLLLSNQLSLKI